MRELVCGQVVKSKAGRDKGKLFVIVEKADAYVYLADGQSRRIENPKKKKSKHIQPTNTVIDTLKSKLDYSDKVSNTEIRKKLAVVQEENNPS